MYYKSQGCRFDYWIPGLTLGAVRRGQTLHLSLEAADSATRWSGRVRFDFARHRRVMNYDQNYVRLNEFPEWYVVDENTLYRVSSASHKDSILLGSELIAGVPLSAGNWTIEPLGPPPIGPLNQPSQSK
jgi:hypothetical protein